MKPLKIATAQFQNRSGDKKYNLSVIRRLTAKAAGSGADIIAFHECSITGYTFARHLFKEQLLAVAEPIPDGPSIVSLTRYARKFNIVILAGLFERDADGNIFKAYVCVDKNGLAAKHRKLHPFINPHILPGDSYTVFKINDWKCGILICYDNNIIENVRATVLKGAQIMFMPHVTMCTPSARPGSGFVDVELWKDKKRNKRLLRKEFDGPKGRKWLMRWLPSRAHDNGVYVVFANPIGIDGDQLKNGCSMILDPFGAVIAECRTLSNEVALAQLNPETLEAAGGKRYIKARKPQLYKKIIGREHQSEQKVAWMHHANPSE